METTEKNLFITTFSIKHISVNTLFIKTMIFTFFIAAPLPNTPSFESSITTSSTNYHSQHQLGPVSVSSMIPKIEEWSNSTPYGVTPPTQVTSVNLEGLDKRSPNQRSLSSVQSSTEEVSRYLDGTIFNAKLGSRSFQTFTMRSKISRAWIITNQEVSSLWTLF